jgi:hypothetical protein
VKVLGALFDFIKVREEFRVVYPFLKKIANSRVLEKFTGHADSHDIWSKNNLSTHGAPTTLVAPGSNAMPVKPVGTRGHVLLRLFYGLYAN